jgi:hypothetical protein
VTAVAPGMEIKVRVGDTWMPLVLAVAPSDTVAAVKTRALAEGGIRRGPAEYEVKVGGVLVRDESQTLAAAGIKHGAPVVILSRRRRPVR